MKLSRASSYALAAQTSLFANGTAEISDRGESIGGTAGIRLIW